MSGQWYYTEDGAQYGPVDEAVIIRLIRDGELPIGTPVLQEGHMDWQPARDHACFQVEIYPKKKRPPVQDTASTASKPVTGGNLQSASQTTAQPAVIPASPVVTPAPVQKSTVLSWVVAGVTCIALGLGYWVWLPKRDSGGGKKEPAFLKQGLVAYYPFNGNAKDESGNGNDGKVIGPMLTKDRHGKDASAFYFDGKEDYISIGDSETLRVGRLTISVHILHLGGQAIVYKAERTDGVRPPIGEQYGLHVQPTVYFTIKRNSGGVPGQGWQYANSNHLVKLEGWTMITATWDGLTQTIYINGERAGTNDTAPKGDIDDVKGGHLLIGGNWHPARSMFRGKIDDIRIYNRALSEAEVKELYEFEKPKIQQASTATPPAVVTPDPVKPKPNPANPKPTPTRKLTLEEKKFVGTYERKREDGNTSKYVFLENGVYEDYTNGTRYGRRNKWSIVNGELHLNQPLKMKFVFRINIRRSITDRSIVMIAAIFENGYRKDLPIKDQRTYKRIN